MRTTIRLLIACFAVAACAARARADHVIVRLGDAMIPMEGKIADPKARIITVTHEKFRNVKLNLYYRNRNELLSIEEMILVPSRRELYQRQFSKSQKGSVTDRLELASWATKHGMVPELYKAIDLTLEAEPDNAKAKEILALRDRLAEPLPESSEEQRFMSDLLGGGMKFKSSAHYVVAYDTTDAKAQERIDLLERVYETFFMYFALKGRVLEKPPQRLMVALFADYKNYIDFSVRLSPDLKSAAGYWSPEINVAVFYAQGTHPLYKQLSEASAKLESDKKEAERLKLPNRGDLVRFADTIRLLMMVAEENEDVETVTHEATHQIAGNNGLFPRRIRIPKFAQEGLAAFFESPSDATWSGVGAINQNRINWYRALENDRVHSNIDFIVTDRVYSRAQGIGSNIMHAYGQAWGLTHFLMDKHFTELNEYWRNLARLPADMTISEGDLKNCFDAAFGADRNQLDTEWRRHMNSLQTDSDKLHKEFGDKLK